MISAGFGSDVSRESLLEFVDAGNDLVIAIDSSPSELMRSEPPHGHSPCALSDSFTA